jgi:transcriptional regulator with XRE-family HTH domain
MSTVNRLLPRICPYDEGAMAGRPPTREQSEFGKRLAAIRKARGMSQVEFARMLGVSQKTANYYERRTTNPSLELIERLSAALSVSTAELLGGERPARKTRERPGPPSQLERAVERVRKLPRGEQQRIVELIDDAVARAERRLAG